MNGSDRKLIVDAPLGYGSAACTECGRLGERRLASRFPHVCHVCLFPPPRKEDPTADAPAFLPVARLLDELQQLNVAIGSMFPGERRID